MDEQTSEVEQQRPQTPTSAWAGLLAIVIVAGVLRYLGITWGLPNELHLFSYHPDEFHSLRGAISLVTGDLNPHFFNYGSLYLYLVGFSCLLSSGGQVSMVGFDHVPQLLQFWTLIGREVTLTTALLTVVAVYWLARQISDHRQGLIAAALCSVFPIHVLHSHYATVDITQVLFTTLVLLFAVRIYQQPSWLNYVLAGLVVGLAASTKYNGAVAIVAPLTAHSLRLVWQRSEATPKRNLWWLLAIALAAFVLTSPYIFLDWEHAWRDISYELQHMRLGEEPARSADPNGYWFHLVNLTITTTGATIFAILGAWALLRTKRCRAPAMILVIFSVIWLAMIGASGVRYMRYEMPLVPVLAVLAAASPLLVWSRRAEWKLAAILAVAALLGASTYYSVQLDRELMEPDDRDRMLWVVGEYVPQYRTVGTIWEPWFQGPPLDYVNGGAMLRENPLWQTYSRPVRPHVTLGLDAKTLQEFAPYAVTYSNFEVRDALRVGQTGALEFMEALAADYDKTWESDTRAPLAGCCGWVPPQDWLYPFPELHLWITKHGVAETEANTDEIDTSSEPN